MTSSKFLLRLLAASSVISLFGCSSPDPAPFKSFATGAAAVGTAADQAVKETASVSRDCLISSVTDIRDFNSLKLRFICRKGHYVWGNTIKGDWAKLSPPPPQPALSAAVPAIDEAPPEVEISTGAIWMDYYYKPQREAQHISQFNSVFTDYANSLSTLAGQQVISDADFTKLATDLNTQVEKLAAHAKYTDPAGFAIFSTSATFLFREYVKSQQRKFLREAIEKNTPVVKQFSELGQDLVVLLATPVNEAYKAQFEQWKHVFRTAKDDDGRKKAVQAVVALNDAMIVRWQLLSQLDHTYAEIPKAHAKLPGAVDGKDGLAGFADLTQSAAQLYKTYNDLKDSNEKADKAAAATTK